MKLPVKKLTKFNIISLLTFTHAIAFVGGIYLLANRAQKPESALAAMFGVTTHDEIIRIDASPDADVPLTAKQVAALYQSFGSVGDVYFSGLTARVHSAPLEEVAELQPVFGTKPPNLVHAISQLAMLTQIADRLDADETASLETKQKLVAILQQANKIAISANYFAKLEENRGQVVATIARCFGRDYPIGFMTGLQAHIRKVETRCAETVSKQGQKNKAA